MLNVLDQMPVVETLRHVSPIDCVAMQEQPTDCLFEGLVLYFHTTQSVVVRYVSIVMTLCYKLQYCVGTNVYR